MHINDRGRAIFDKMARDDFELPCRKCGNIVIEAESQCRKCGTYAPGIYSECPICHSTNYTWKPYGMNKKAAFGGLILMGPIGGVVGAALGSNDAECICLNCGQGWMPFAFPGGKWNTTRKFKLKKNVSVSNQNSNTIKKKSEIRPVNTKPYQVNQTKAVSRNKEEGIVYKLLTFLIALISIALILIIGVKVFNWILSDKTESRETWEQAYARYISGGEGYDEADEKYYELADMNDDGVPELIYLVRYARGESMVQICKYDEEDGLISTKYKEYDVKLYATTPEVIFFFDWNEGAYLIRCKYEHNTITTTREYVDEKLEEMQMKQLIDGKLQ